MTSHQPSTPTAHPPAPRAAPLWAVLWLTGLSSIGTGVGWNGIYYITQHVYDFSKQQNLLLAALQGLVYALAALAAAPIVRKLERRGGLSLRAGLAIVLASSAALALLPILTHHPIAIWAFAAGYMILAGMTWPMVEAYLSAGRSTSRLRTATGLFNITWSSATFIAMWAQSALASLARAEGLDFLATAGPFVLLALAHALSIPLLAKFPSNAAHAPDSEALSTHEIPPKLARSLLKIFRIELILSYTLIAGLSPILPEIMDRLGVSAPLRPALVTSWMVTRLLVFILFQRSSFWHGRYRTPIWAGGLTLIGVALILSATNLGMLIPGLAILGIGAGAIYSAALYYAMEAGAASVDAGGRHEALIGAGYTVGPLLGLLALSILA